MSASGEPGGRGRRLVGKVGGAANRVAAPMEPVSGFDGGWSGRSRPPERSARRPAGWWSHPWPGSAFPLGATYDGTGTNFSVFSEVADGVELCLFDPSGHEHRIALVETTAFCWHPYLSGIGPGQCYGFRVHGPHDPASGLRCNPAKLLLDPYAIAVDGEVRWDPAVYGYPPGGDPDTVNAADSGPFVPKAVVTNPFFDWGHGRPPRTPWHDTVLYELHVKGFTATHPDIPPSCRVPTPGWLPGRHRLPDQPGDHRGGAHARPPFRPRTARVVSSIDHGAPSG